MMRIRFNNLLDEYDINMAEFDDIKASEVDRKAKELLREQLKAELVILQGNIKQFIG